MRYLKYLFLFITFQVFGQNIIGFNEAEVNELSSFDLEFNLTNAEGVKAIQFDIPINTSAIELLSGHQLSERASGFSISVSVVNQSSLRVVLFSVNGSVINSGTGEVFKLKLKSKTLPGTYTINITNEVISGVNGSSLAFEKSSSSIIVKGSHFNLVTTSLNFGRVPIGNQATGNITISNSGNEPLIISSTNIAAPFSILTGLPLTINANSSSNLSVGLNTDAKYNSNISLNYVSNDNDPLRKIQSSSISANVYAVNEIHIGAGSGEIHSEVFIPVLINNMEPFNGFQFDVILPNNVSYVLNSTELSSRKTDHIISASIVETNKLRIVSYSPSNSNFTGAQGEVLTFKLKPSVSSGSYTLRIQNPIITHSTLGDIESDSYNGTLSINAPNLVTSFSSYDFGRIPTTGTHTKNLILTNNGRADLNISSFIYDQSYFTIDEALPILLEPNQSQEITIQVLKSTPLSFNQDISIRHNDPDSQNIVNLRGILFSPNFIEVENSVISVPSDTFDVVFKLSNNDPVTAIQFDVQMPAEFNLSANDFFIF